MIREKGIRVESLAILESLEHGKVEFKEEGTHYEISSFRCSTFTCNVCRCNSRSA